LDLPRHHRLNLESSQIRSFSIRLQHPGSHHQPAKQTAGRSGTNSPPAVSSIILYHQKGQSQHMNERVPHTIISAPHHCAGASNDPDDPTTRHRTPTTHCIQITVEGSTTYNSTGRVVSSPQGRSVRELPLLQPHLNSPTRAPSRYFEKRLRTFRFYWTPYIYSSDSSIYIFIQRTTTTRDYAQECSAAFAFLAGYFGIRTNFLQVTRYFEDYPLELVRRLCHALP